MLTTVIGTGRIAILLLLLICCTGCQPSDSQQTIKIGYLLCNSEQETRQRFTPLTRYLSAKVGVECIMLPVEATDFERRFRAGEFTFARTNSLLYTMVAENNGARLVAAEKRGNFGSRTAGVIIARQESGITRLDEIAGKSMAFGSIFAPAGYLAEYDMLLAAGIDPEKDFGHYTTPRGSYKHEKLVYGVLYGAYDVAAVPLLDLEVMTREGKISANDFTIIAQSSMVPYCTFTAAGSVDQKLLRKFRQALVDLNPNDTVTVDGEQVKVMKAAWIDGYEELAESDYNLLRDMAVRVNKHQQQP